VTWEGPKGAEKGSVARGDKKKKKKPTNNYIKTNRAVSLNEKRLGSIGLNPPPVKGRPGLATCAVLHRTSEVRLKHREPLKARSKYKTKRKTNR
jgi:hypothetical protein